MLVRIFSKNESHYEKSLLHKLGTVIRLEGKPTKPGTLQSNLTPDFYLNKKRLILINVKKLFSNHPIRLNKIDSSDVGKHRLVKTNKHN